ncbi:helix-turn-helix domain-containing protein, partial [Ruthenibacterium lactatiformans]
TQYQAYEQGRIVPKFETAYRLAHALRFSLDECATTIFVVVSQE